MLHMSLGILTRANEESRLKSTRLRQSWENKRTAAQMGVASRMRLPAQGHDNNASPKERGEFGQEWGPFWTPTWALLSNVKINL